MFRVSNQLLGNLASVPPSLTGLSVVVNRHLLGSNGCLAMRGRKDRSAIVFEVVHLFSPFKIAHLIGVLMISTYLSTTRVQAVAMKMRRNLHDCITLRHTRASVRRCFPAKCRELNLPACERLSRCRTAMEPFHRGFRSGFRIDLAFLLP